ncbi:MAG: DNA-binding response regulator, partial [Variovorax paradoxus]
MSTATPVRLFLVDDHPLVRDGLRARLGTMPGLEIVGEAGSAAEALAQVDALRPDLMLVDVGMKDMNGIELAALLLQRPAAPHIVMLSM